jgi:molybdenum cofactor synthesis domain-containing protein
VVSAETVPPFDNTAMDGFAVRSADTVGAPRRLKIVGELAAGAAPSTAVEQGEAIRIMTGAPMPPGADAVVMVERTAVDPGGREVEVGVEVIAGNHVRRAGDDLEAGAVVFEPGEALTAGHLGVLCSIGVTVVEVVKRPRVGVISTGDELVDDGSALAPGQIRDSNRRTLLTLVADSGCDAVDLGLVRDDEEAIAAAIEAGAFECDALVTSGGVSMGDFDYVKSVLDRIGDMRWMQVAIKPAKPLAFGTVGGVPVFGLPGNPVSSMVSFELFARAGLRKMAGHTVLDRPHLAATAMHAFGRRDDGKTHFVRVGAEVVDGRVEVRSAGAQGSHQLTAMAHADALAILEPETPIGEGDEVSIIPLRLPGW